MPFSRSRLSSALALLSLAVGASSAEAQVTLRLNTAQQTNCTATTDAGGLSLVPGSTDLQANGVTLSGNGCGTNGADFQANLNVPSATTAGTPVTVTWSAGQAATRCVYGGSAGLTGWPIGTVACTGAACAAPLPVQVTPGAAGSYDLSITCTNDSGFRVKTLAATAAPNAPQPPDFVLTANPAAPAVNTPFQVSWAVTGATSCAGTVKFNDTPLASLAGWTDTNSAASPRNVTASQAGTYKLSLACSNAVGTTTSQEAAVVVGGGTTACTSTVPGLTRLERATITYPNVPSGGTRTNADLTRFENIWGAAKASDAPVGWPGKNGAVPAINSWGRTRFVAAKFTAPASTAQYERISVSTYNSDVMTMAVSTNCGDFSPSDSRCVMTAGAGDPLVKTVVSPQTAGCPLTPGVDYYFNVKYANPQDPGCGSACNIAMPNSVGNF